MWSSSKVKQLDNYENYYRPLLAVFLMPKTKEVIYIWMNF